MGVIKTEEKEEKVPILRRCPACKIGRLETIFEFNSRGPPKGFESFAQYIFD